ncbi:MAG: YHS domain-containing protein [Thermoplasmata archaeon]|nr:YHS domain-containing protein [Thermoplasmata archaeon]MCI4359654.1 YHS domain-containing protein [Thermoplasmata archaeon]
MKVKDPVCHMTVDTDKTPHKSERGGERFYFCSAACRVRFESEGRK